MSPIKHKDSLNVVVGALVIGVILIGSQFSAFQEMVDSKSWRQTRAIVVSASLEPLMYVKIPVSRPRVDFKYQVKGREFLANDNFAPFESPAIAEKQKSSIAIGSSITAFYDPANPSRAVLNPGEFKGSWSALFWGAMLIVVGLFGLIVGLTTGFGGRSSAGFDDRSAGLGGRSNAN